jgi:FkbM family methyltransferase
MLGRWGRIRDERNRRRRLRTLGFRTARGLLYRVLIPLFAHSGPLEPIALRLFRALTRGRPAGIEGLPCPVHLDGMTLWHDPDRPSNTVRALAAGGYEQAIAGLFQSTLRPGMTVLDVGAHIGYFSLLAARQVGPSGRVWSFEPDPANRADLERNIEANAMGERITVVPLAVSAAVGEASLHQMTGDTGSSSLFPGGQTVEQRSNRGIPVGTTSLDAWARSEGWPTIDLLKVDAEGAEGAILAGMAELVERNPKMVVVLEFQADALEAAGEDPIGFLGRLRAIAPGRVRVLDDGSDGAAIASEDFAKLTRRSRWSPLNLALGDPAAPGDRRP